MNNLQSNNKTHNPISETAYLWYRIFKYTIYGLLACNIYLYFKEDLAGSAQTFAAEISWHNFVEAYSSTVDTAAWVILLLLFELETAVIPDERLQGRLKWLLAGIRGLCYLLIVYSLYGYIGKFAVISQTELHGVIDVCARMGTDTVYYYTLGDYRPLSETVCQSLQGQDIYQITGTDIIGSSEHMRLAYNLALTDIINASTWLLVVAFLELEVLQQLSGLLTDHRIRIAKAIKTVLYSVLLACAVYWGIDGDFLDFWDALLWIVAFVFIELNIFQWPLQRCTSTVACTIFR